jgi:N-acetyltransferase
MRTRPARADDYSTVTAVIAEWWGGRDLAGLLQPLFFEHFGSTSLIIEDEQGLAAFLIGFDSADERGTAYIHFIGVRPDLRAAGLGRSLYEEFAARATERGIRTLRCVTSPVNTGSIAFHQRVGFAIDERTIDAPASEYVHFVRHLDAWPAQPTVEPARWPWSDDLRFSHGDITLAPFRESDAHELFEALDDDAVWEHVRGRPSSSADVATTMAAAQGNGRWPLVVRKGERIVGTTSFLELSTVDARCEIGFTLYAREVWGGVVNPTCKLLMMTWAFETCGMNRVQLKTDIRNLRSQAAIERMGATREGVLRMYQRRQDDSIRDTVMYSVLTHEWPGVKEHLLSRLMP